MNGKITIGTRGSQLALWQARFIEKKINAIDPSVKIEIKIIKTKGDKARDLSLKKIDDKSFFTEEIEEELMNGRIDAAVHSMKDLPAELPEDLWIVAIPERHNPEDVLISRDKGTRIQDLKAGATLASGSLRRSSQLLNLRPDFKIADIRGNVPTRIKKFLDSSWDAIVLARAGVERLGLDEHISSIIPVSDMMPAATQGTLAVEIKRGRDDLAELLSKIDHRDSRITAKAERSFLRTVQGGCRLPVGAFAVVDKEEIFIEGFIGETDGSRIFRESLKFPAENPEKAGTMLARRLIDLGAGQIIERLTGRPL